MKTVSDPSELRFATVGYGGAFNMGKQHIEYASHAGMVPAAVVEIAEDRRAAAKADFPDIEVFESVEALIESGVANIAAVLTPHNSHAEIGLKLLRGGLHVIEEKPMAIHTEECDEMIEVAAENELLVTAYHNRHWDGGIIRAKQLIDEGAIGNVYKAVITMGGRTAPWPTWRGSKSLTGGLSYDWGVHCLEYSLQIIDSDVVEVSGYTRKGYWAQQSDWGEDTVEDEVFFTVRFKDGRWLSLTQTNLDSDLPQGGFVRFVGEEGSIRLYPEELRVLTDDGKERIERRFKTDELTECYAFYDNIAAALRGKESLIITPEWSRRMIHILDLADRSAREGCALHSTYR